MRDRRGHFEDPGYAVEGNSYHTKNALDLQLKDGITFPMNSKTRKTLETVFADPPFSGTFNVRLNPDIHQRLAMRAAHDGVSLNKWVARTLERAVSEQHA